MSEESKGLIKLCGLWKSQSADGKVYYSLENPDVKYVKVFRAATLKGNKKRFTAEEEKGDLVV